MGIEIRITPFKEDVKVVGEIYFSDYDLERIADVFKHYYEKQKINEIEVPKYIKPYYTDILNSIIKEKLERG